MTTIKSGANSFSENTITIGNGTVTGNKTIVFNTGAGSNPEFRYSVASNLMQLSTNGTDFYNILNSSEAMITPDGGLAIKMVNKTGASSIKGDVLQLYQSWVISNDTNSKLSSLTLSGVTMTNSTAGRLWIQLYLNTGAATVQVYQDSGCTIPVCSGALADNLGGTITLVDAGPGVSGSVVVAADISNDFDIYATLGFTKGVIVCVGGTLAAGITAKLAGVMYSDAVDDNRDVWVVVSGKAYVRTYAGASIGGYLYMDALAPPDGGKAKCEITRTAAAYNYYGVGRALERVESGLVLAELDLRDGPRIAL